MGKPVAKAGLAQVSRKKEEEVDTFSMFQVNNLKHQ